MATFCLKVRTFAHTSVRLEFKFKKQKVTAPLFFFNNAVFWKAIEKHLKPTFSIKYNLYTYNPVFTSEWVTFRKNTIQTIHSLKPSRVRLNHIYIDVITWFEVATYSSRIKTFEHQNVENCILTSYWQLSQCQNGSVVTKMTLWHASDRYHKFVNNGGFWQMLEKCENNIFEGFCRMSKRCWKLKITFWQVFEVDIAEI